MRKRRRAREIVYITIIFILIIIIIFLSLRPMVRIEEIPYPIPDDFVKTDVLRVQDSSVIIGKGCTAIVAQTSLERAESIALGIKGKIDVRPNAHESFVTVLKAFNLSLEAVLIHKLEGNTYYSDAIFRKGENVIQLDMRPSDAIALAVRTKSPIYVNKMLLEKTGTNIC